MAHPVQPTCAAPRAAATASTTGTSQTPCLFGDGYDELLTQQTLACIGTRRVSDTLSCLLEAMRHVDPTARLDNGWNTGRSHRLRGAHFDLHLKTPPGDWFVRLDAHPDALHLRLQVVWKGMEDFHSLLAAAPPRGSAALIPWRVLDYALHGDVGPLVLTPALLRRFPPTRYKRHGWTENGAYTWERWGQVVTLYDKTAEILAHPSKAYIEEFWRENGWESGVPICRFETRPLRRKGASVATQSPQEAWMWAVDKFSPGPARPTKGAKRRRRHPAWYALRRATFTAPWNPDSLTLPPRVPVANERLVKQTTGQYLSALAGLSALLDCTGSTATTLSTAVLERLTAADGDLEADLRRRVAIARARRGLEP